MSTSPPLSVAHLAGLFGCSPSSAQTLADAKVLLPLQLEGKDTCDVLTALGGSLHDTQHTLDDMTNAMRELVELDTKPKGKVLMSEFCHLHLPAFIRAFRAAAHQDVRFDCACSLDDALWAVLFALREMPDLSRYVREYEGGSSLLLDAMRYLSSWIRKLAAKMKANPRWASEEGDIIGYLHFALVSLRPLVCFSSTGTTFTPDLKSPTGLALLRDLDNLRVVISLSTSFRNQSRKQHVASLDFELVKTRGTVEGGCIHAECAVQRDHMRAGLPWLSCEGREFGSCKKPKKGAEMMQCSRCRAVRYCCPAHQRAHWKKHKPFCRKPIW